jgi:hypothetical protein
MGVPRVAVPNRSTHSEERRKLENNGGSAPASVGGRDVKAASVCSNAATD